MLQLSPHEVHLDKSVKVWWECLKVTYVKCMFCTWQFHFAQVDTSSVQAEEVWTGITYAVAASMIQEVILYILQFLFTTLIKIDKCRACHYFELNGHMGNHLA